jgi:predicted translin family RNA/ssDNA-binding protein
MNVVSPLLNQNQKNVLFFFHEKSREKIGMIYKFSGEKEIHVFHRKSMNLSKNVFSSKQSALETKKEALKIAIEEIESLEKKLEDFKSLKKTLMNEIENLELSIQISNYNSFEY